MTPKSVICVVVDRLHAGMIGAYGNSWIRAGQLDHLACESFVFDQALTDCPRLDRFHRAVWRGVPGWVAERDDDGASFPGLAGAAGMHTALLTDERQVASLPVAADFSESIFVESHDPTQAAEDVSQTLLARLFGTATEWLAAARPPFCLWLHARGMSGAWDAPSEFRDQYAEEGDPQPPPFVEVPNRWLPEDYDPDELLGISHAYAGQVSLLDVCTGALVDAIAQSGLADSTQVTFLSARGFPLGEHRRVGPCDDALYNESLQIPWLMRFPDGLGKLSRSQALVRPADLPGTLLDWLGLDRGRLGTGNASSLLDLVRGDDEGLRDRIVSVSHHDRAIRTPAWHLRQPSAGAPELYAKPSDRWEVNEVANLLPEISTALQAALAEAELGGESDALAPLLAALTTEVD